MKGKTVLVTGATSGIGKAAAFELARLGAELILVARSQSKLDATAHAIGERTNNPNVTSIRADLSSLSEVRDAANVFLHRWSRLDVLLNNAGAMFVRRQESTDGYEMTLALNHLSCFLLSRLLLSTLRETAEKYDDARIINVSSGLHAKANLDLQDPQLRVDYSGITAYSRSKLMNVMFTYALARHLQGAKVTANALEPGVVRTGFGRNNGLLASHIVMPIIQMFGKSPEQGAETSVYLATSPEIKGVTSKYWKNREQTSSSEASFDVTVQEQLWEMSEELVSID